MMARCLVVTTILLLQPVELKDITITSAWRHKSTKSHIDRTDLNDLATGRKNNDYHDKNYERFLQIRRKENRKMLDFYMETNYNRLREDSNTKPITRHVRKIEPHTDKRYISYRHRDDDETNGTVIGTTVYVERNRTNPVSMPERQNNVGRISRIGSATGDGINNRISLKRWKRDATESIETNRAPISTLVSMTSPFSTQASPATGNIGFAPLIPFTTNEPTEIPSGEPGSAGMSRATVTRLDSIEDNIDVMLDDVEETQPESEPEPDPGPEPEPEPFPEPSPDWTTAHTHLGIAWFIHIYGFAGASLLIGIFASLSLARIVKTGNMTKRTLNTTLNGLMILFGFSRGAYLIVNPYGTLQRIPMLESRLMWSIGFPCLTSMMTTLLLVLFDTTKVSLGPPKYQKLRVVLTLSVSHFSVVMGTEILLSFYLVLKVLLLVCKVIYVTWGITLTIGYYTVGHHISKNFKASRDLKTVNDGAEKMLQKLIFACGTVAILNCATHIYEAVGVLGIYSDIKHVPAWHWWIFQTLMRSEEMVMCLIVLTLLGLSNRSYHGDGRMNGFTCKCLFGNTCTTSSKRKETDCRVGKEKNMGRKGVSHQMYSVTL